MKSELKVLQLQGLFVSELKVAAENLDVLIFYSIICPTEDLSIYAPRLQKFQCDGLLFSRMLPIEKFVMEQHQIPVHCNDLLVSSNSFNTSFALLHNLFIRVFYVY